LFHSTITSCIEQILPTFIDSLFGGYASRVFLPSLNGVPLECGTPAVSVEDIWRFRSGGLPTTLLGDRLFWL